MSLDKTVRLNLGLWWLTIHLYGARPRSPWNEPLPRLKAEVSLGKRSRFAENRRREDRRLARLRASGQLSEEPIDLDLGTIAPRDPAAPEEEW